MPAGCHPAPAHAAALARTSRASDRGPARSGGPVSAGRPGRGGGRRAGRGAAGPRRPGCPGRTPGRPGGPRCPQPRGQSSMAAARSSNAAGTSSGVTWASPNERTPGCRPPSRRRAPRAAAGPAPRRWCAAPCRPPTPGPTASAASGTRALTSVDLPTPECPTSADTRPASSCGQLVGPPVAPGHQHRQVQLAVLRGERPPGRPGRPWSGRAPGPARRRRPRPGSGRRSRCAAPDRPPR